MIHLIPAAGLGKRFADKGYVDPKPFIPIFKEPMLLHVLRNIGMTDVNRTDDKYIIILREEHLKIPNSLIKYLIDRQDVTILTVDKTTAGAACTCLLAKELINNDEELWIGDCDHVILDENHRKNATEFFRVNDSDGGLVCHLQQHPKWSYCKVRDNRVVQVAEKDVISDLANTGDYYFKRGKDFVEAAETMIQNNDTSKGEYYVSPVYNYLLAKDLKINAYMVNRHVGLGTPEDLERFIHNAKNK